MYLRYLVVFVSNHYRMPCSIPTGLSYTDTQANPLVDADEDTLSLILLLIKTHSQTIFPDIFGKKHREVLSRQPQLLRSTKKTMRLESVDLQLQAFRK